MDENEKIAELMVSELAAQLANQAVLVAQLKASLAISQERLAAANQLLASKEEVA